MYRPNLNAIVRTHRHTDTAPTALW